VDDDFITSPFSRRSGTIFHLGGEVKVKVYWWMLE